MTSPLLAVLFHVFLIERSQIKELIPNDFKALLSSRDLGVTPSSH